MQKYFTVIASFLTMMCLGGIYAWSIFADELRIAYGWSSAQTQFVFGLVIAIFPTTMLLVGKMEKRINSTWLTIISGLFFGFGYFISAISDGNFYIVLLGIGIISGIGTGFGYITALSTPVKWFPEKKGLVTGIAAAGFGLAGLILSKLTELLLISGKDVLQIFGFIGIIYGSLIIALASLVKSPNNNTSIIRVDVVQLIKNKIFTKLLLGIFLGTFAGLLVVGSLKTIGSASKIETHILIMGVSVFAVANFAGRVIWGYLSDLIGGDRCIAIALSIQALTIFLMGYLTLTPLLYIILSVGIGVSFGANFVLFAKETSHHFGIENLSKIYPYIFLGYALAGILGPLTGGILYDVFQNHLWGFSVAAVMSFAGGLLFLINQSVLIKNRY